MKNLFFKSAAFASLALVFTACENTDEPEMPVIPYSDGAYILNFGSGSNKGDFSYYDFTSQEVMNNVFALRNANDALGDGANHMCIYGSKMYVTLNGSAQIKITDLEGKLLKEIPLLDEANKPLKPRYLASHGNYVYFSAYGGSVQRIDTASLNLNAEKIQVGDFPEAMSVVGNKLFVNNSKYTDKNVTDKGNTVSVIDLVSFKKIKDIEVATNPYNQSVAAADGNVYIVSQEDWNGPHTLQRINPTTYEVTPLGEASAIANYGNILYAYYSVGTPWLKTFDLKTNKFSDKEFINVSKFSYINGMNVNPLNGDLYLCDSPDYGRVEGNVHIYNTEGKEIKKIEVGHSPAGAFFPIKNFIIK